MTTSGVPACSPPDGGMPSDGTLPADTNFGVLTGLSVRASHRVLACSAFTQFSSLPMYLLRSTLSRRLTCASKFWKFSAFSTSRTRSITFRNSSFT